MPGCDLGGEVGVFVVGLAGGVGGGGGGGREGVADLGGCAVGFLGLGLGLVGCVLLLLLRRVGGLGVVVIVVGWLGLRGCYGARREAAV